MNNKISRFGHSTKNGKKQNRVFDPGRTSPFDDRATNRATNSKDENRVFDPGGNPPLAEFASMADAGKAALCLRSPLSDMGSVQEQPTETQADNLGATQMATAQQPKQFVILQWSEEDLISFTDCPSTLLTADSLTKQTGRTKFYEHIDIIMGRPKFSPATQTDFAINLVSASNNLRQLHYADIVSSMVE
jgi:hypothetical protein